MQLLVHVSIESTLMLAFLAIRSTSMCSEHFVPIYQFGVFIKYAPLYILHPVLLTR